jgi:hypothetical protein
MNPDFMHFPYDLPPPFFGFALVGFGGVALGSLLITVAMVFVFTRRQALMDVHSLPMFAGLVAWFLCTAFAYGTRTWIVYGVGHDTAAVGSWMLVQKLRIYVVLLQAASGVWILSALAQHWPFMRWYKSQSQLQTEVEMLRMHNESLLRELAKKERCQDAPK